MIIIKIKNECASTSVLGEKDCLKKEFLNELPDQINNLLDSICSNDDEKYKFMVDLQIQIMKSTTFSKRDSAKAALDGIEHIIKKFNETQPQQPKDQNIENSSTPKTKEDIIKILEDDLHLLSFLQEDKSLTVKEYCQIVAQKLAISEFLLEAKSNYYCM